jgi:hypothetical protein
LLFSGNLIGSIVCFLIFPHPSLPRDIVFPQYSHVMIISPNFGAIGAPQLGHFRAVAPEGAMIEVEEPVFPIF